MDFPKNISIIKASAGTGKTFNLVKFYLKNLLYDTKNFYHVLGLTFTKKAAAEMKKRILEDTLKIATGSKHDLYTQIVNENAFLESHDIQKNAQILLNSILFEYSRFEFQTIDSFFYKIVKIFGKDLEIHPNFQIEDDIDLFIELCVEQLFKESSHNEELKDYLLEFVMFRLKEQDSWNLDFPLQELAHEILKDTAYDYLILFKNKSFSDFEKLKTHHLEYIQKYEQEIDSLINQMESLLVDYKITPELCHYKDKGLPSKLKKLRKFKNLEFNDISSILRFLFEKKYFKKNFEKKEILEDNIYQISKELNEKLKIENWKSYKTHWYAFRSLQTSALIYKLWEIGENIKTKHQFILMSDINIKIKDFLQKEPAEYIYWRLGNRYHHFLLDEFQDTSLTQYDNLKPLIETVITTKPDFSSALFVGDVKQSIYRWRGSQPELLQNLHEDASFKYYAQTYVLDTNYRSAPEIVNFVNEFFDHISTCSFDLESIGLNFRDLNQKAHKTQEKGYVKIIRVAKKEGELLSNKEKILNQLLNELDQLKNCEDIAILVRTNSESRLIANFLAQNGISFTASESLLLSNSLSIQFLFEALKLLYYNDDEVTKLTVYNLAQYLEVPFSYEDYQIFSQRIKTYSLYEQTEQLIHYFGLNNPLSSEVIQFLSFVHDYEKAEFKKNLSFWDWFERYSTQESLEGSAKERIKIMTIHQSKGLEFEVVICPFLNWNLYPKTNSKYWGIYENEPYLLSYNKEQKYTYFTVKQGNTLAFNKETEETILENINILYVAITRAKKQFYGWFIPKNEVKEIKSVSDYFQSYFDKIGFKEIEVLEIGKFSDHWEKSPQKETSSILMDTTEPYSWKTQLSLKPIEEEDWQLMIAKNDAMKRGLVIHKIFEKLKYLKDLEQIVEDFVAQGKILPIEKTSVIEKIETLFKNPLLKLWFSENVFILKEQKFIQKEQESKIPDRMVIHEGILYIIDFKTGQKYPEHQQQLMDYENIVLKSNLKTIKPFHTIQKYLVYIDENEIVKIDI